MTIREVCKQTDLTVDTVRYYERIKLIEVEKSAYFKNYSQQTLETLIAIKKLRLAGLSLDEIGRLLSIEVKPSELNQKQFAVISAIVDGAIERVKIRVAEIVESQQLLEKMKNKLNKVRYENM